MDMVAALSTFVRVTETGSFSAVGHERGSTQSAISRQITALEEELGVRLFQRTTRHLALTEDGEAVLAHAREVLEAVAATRDAAGRRSNSPAGHVRLALPIFAASVLASRVPALLSRYPDLSLELVTSDGEHDMIEERLDLWVRLGESTHASHVTRRIGTTRPLIVAAPSYIAARGMPHRPDDLAGHDCIVRHRYGHDNLWRFDGPEGEAIVLVAGRFSADNSAAVLRAALAGVGVALLADVLAGLDVDAGRLCVVLPGFRPAGEPITAIYPSRRNLSPRVRVVIDFMTDGLIGRSTSSPLAA